MLLGVVVKKGGKLFDSINEKSHQMFSLSNLSMFFFLVDKYVNAGLFYLIHMQIDHVPPILITC
jgi:hypothetical protein